MVDTKSTIFFNKLHLDVAEFQREKIQSLISPSKKKNKVTARIPQIEDYVLKLFEEAEAKNDGGLTGPFVRTKALQYAKSLGHDNFSASKGWLLLRIFNANVKMFFTRRHRS